MLLVGPGITPGSPPATGVPNPQDPLGGGDRALWVVLATVPRLGVRAWCRGRGPAVFQLFTRSLLGSGRSLRVVGLVIYALKGIMLDELAG